MSRASFLLIACVLGLVACKRPKAPWRQAEVAPPAPPAVPPEPPAAPPIEERIVDGMGLTIRARHRDASGVEFVIANASREPIHVRTTLVIERKTDSDFVPTEPPTTVSLRHDCDAEPPECTTLAPGAEWFPPRTALKNGSRSCAADSGTETLHGDLRVIAMSCDGTTRYLGEPFHN